MKLGPNNVKFRQKMSTGRLVFEERGNKKESIECNLHIFNRYTLII